MLDAVRFVTAPVVVPTGQTVIQYNQVIESAEALDRVDAAETEGTPLSNMLERLAMSPDMNGGGDEIAEYAGRQCYDSFAAGRGNKEYIENILDQGHGSVLEHASLVFQVVGVSRNLTHELIRHRVGTAYSQESQRYVDADQMRFVIPPLLMKMLGGRTGEAMFEVPAFVTFAKACTFALASYKEMQIAFTEEARAAGLKGHELKKRVNEASRYVIPGAAETKLVFTCNMRELRHILTLRGGDPADLEIRRFANAMLPHAQQYAPLIFADMAHRADELDLAPVIEKLLKVA